MNSISWPPFPKHIDPVEIQGLIQDWTRAPLQKHLSKDRDESGPLVSIVIPCFNPDPIQFAQLLLSIQQQTDQNFDLLLVNDGSEPKTWELIQKQIDNHSWIRVLDRPFNQGISAALNYAISEALTPYVALVDQDDLLHPAAMALVNRRLRLDSNCGLLYTDHIIFEDDGSKIQYIPKFAWNPDALLEFNYLIHLTVVRVDLFISCGGMDSHFDGIQDWEFYLRLSKFLSAKHVIYLPVPLYAWRLSDNSTATSAKPKRYLLDLAREFIESAHESLGEGTCFGKPSSEETDYRFLVRYSEAVGDAKKCNVLIFSDPTKEVALLHTIQSLQSVNLKLGQVFVCISEEIPYENNQQFSRKDFLIKFISVNDLPTSIPLDQSLLVLPAGASLCFDTLNKHFVNWLEQTTRWQSCTFPCFVSDRDQLCISSGYSQAPNCLDTFLPNGQGLRKAEYDKNFGSFAHIRKVDLPSPSVQFLSSSILKETFDLLKSYINNGSLSYLSWWSCLAQLDWSCCCIPGNWVSLDSSLADVEYHFLAQRECQKIKFIPPNVLFSFHPGHHFPSFGYWLEAALNDGRSKLHPLQTYEFFKRADVHPLNKLGAESDFYQTILTQPLTYLSIVPGGENIVSSPSSGRNLSGSSYYKDLMNYFENLSLLPRVNHRPIVMLIPTDLNPRSNGHACMLTLAMEMKKAGHNLYLLPFKPYKFFRNYLSKLPSHYSGLSFIANPDEVSGALLIVPESAPRALIKRLRKKYKQLLWWLLAPAGVLTEFRPDIRTGDRLVAFSEFVLPGQTDYLFVHPQINKLMSKQVLKFRHQESSKRQILLYTGKGRLKPLPRSLHRNLLDYTFTLITRSFPSSKDDLIRLLIESNGLISCDPLTNLNLEAANIGIPVYLTGNPFEKRCYTKFPSDLSSFITDSPGEFIQKVKSPSLARKPLSTDSLYSKSLESARLLEFLSSEPAPIGVEPYIVTNDLLNDIDNYRFKLLKSKTIQAYYNGQSVSSSFVGFYMRSFKYPYSIHMIISRLLQSLDACADLLSYLKLFRQVNTLNSIFKPSHFIRYCLRPFSKLLRKIIG